MQYLTVRQLSAAEVEARQRVLEEGNYQIFEHIGDRLIRTICEDASSGTDIAKAVVFTALFLH